MYALLGILVLAAAPAAPAEGVTWVSDYGVARDKSAADGKPIAVIIGRGKSGWNKISQDGDLGDQARQTLKKNYVCVYVDLATEDGKALAESFEMPGLGIVLSDRTGELQAFRHEGDLPDARLNRYLEKFADPGLAVRTTETNPSRRSYYGPGQPGVGAAGGYCPSCSSCPNGRCR